jgi:hypothetical protein
MPPNNSFFGDFPTSPDPLRYLAPIDPSGPNYGGHAWCGSRPWLYPQSCPPFSVCWSCSNQPCPWFGCDWPWGRLAPWSTFGVSFCHVCGRRIVP